MLVRKSTAVWEGGLRNGKGTMKIGAGTYEGKYSFASRFEQGPGTNPEELIGAAHAGCFSMALSLVLEQAGFKPERIDTTARVSLDKVPEGFKITTIELKPRAGSRALTKRPSGKRPKRLSKDVLFPWH